MFPMGKTSIGLDGDFFVIAGPCVIESEQVTMGIAQKLAEIQKSTGVNILFKASFDKANRSSISSYRGPGIDEGLRILEKIRNETGFCIVTDIHEPQQTKPAAEVADCLQIPAFLCRQTDLLVACAKTSKPVNIKKGQFLSPGEMKNVVEKIKETGNDKIMLNKVSGDRHPTVFTYLFYAAEFQY